MSTIQINNVTKQYGDTTALKNVSLEFKENSIYGLLGRNGAGKTTLVNIVTNRIFATSGEVLINGVNARENDTAQAEIFCMTEKSSYPVEMKVQQALEWARCFYGGFDMDYALSLAKDFSLDLKKRIKALSTGYSGVLKLIITLASGAPVIIFDEPVLGLDANYRQLFYKRLIENYTENPRTVIIATHLIEEVSDVLENLVIVEDGEIIIDKSVEEVLSSAYIVSGKGEDVEKFTASKNVIKTESFGGIKAATVFEKLTAAEKERAKKSGLELGRAKLQELFVKLTDKGSETEGDK